MGSVNDALVGLTKIAEALTRLAEAQEMLARCSVKAVGIAAESLAVQAELAAHSQALEDALALQRSKKVPKSAH